MNRIWAPWLLSGLLIGAPAAWAADQYSVAEQKIFLDHHLDNIKHSTTLQYDFKQTGKPEDSFEDRVRVSIKESGKGKSSKTIGIDYLSGAHKIALPEVGDAQGNPVVLYFLEMDVRDMHRLVGGQEAYFRKRIRIALAESAMVRPVTINYAGHAVAASEIRIAPYTDDPLKSRFGKFFTKSYTFIVSNLVPGGVYQIRTQIDDPEIAKPDAAPLMQAVLTLHSGGG